MTPVDRVFLDANVLYSAAWSTTSRLRRLWKILAIELATSARALEEARRNLAIDRPAALTEFEVLARSVMVVPEPRAELLLPAEMVLPEKDRVIFLAAMAASSAYFVTGDKKHFGVYCGMSIGGVIIAMPSEFLSARDVPDT